MVAARRDGAARERDDAQEGAFKTEHTAAYALAAVSLILTIIGLLRGFGVLGNDGTGDAGSPGTQDIGFPAVWDSAIWLLPAISAALLSLALHRNDHHRDRDPGRASDADEASWKTEHGLAYLMALASIVMGVLGMVVGFNVLGRDFGDQPDGLPWLLGSVAAAILANTLHSVRHHQLSRDDDFMVERRTDRVTAGTAMTRDGDVAARR